MGTHGFLKFWENFKNFFSVIPGTHLRRLSCYLSSVPLSQGLGFFTGAWGLNARLLSDKNT